MCTGLGGVLMTKTFVGVDWGEDHHGVIVMAADGRVLAQARIAEGVAGIRQLHGLIADHTEALDEVVIGIETDRGLLVGALAAAGYDVVAVNPKAVDRYRDRHAVSGAKSDGGDAKVLADLVRTDAHNHRRVAGDSDLSEAVKVLARSHHSLIWARQGHLNALRSALREFYPGALSAFGTDLAHPDAVAILSKAPTPQLGRRLSTAQIASALRKGGRQRGIDARANQIRDALRAEQLAAPPAVEDAYGATVTALMGVISTLNRQITELEAILTDHFEQHPDADILRSLPGLGVILGARVLGEFGDDPNRYQHARSRKNYAGTSPITKQSGRRKSVHARYVRNRHLYDALHRWAFCSLRLSPGARAFYDARRRAGDGHNQALRAMANRWVGILHGCLRHRTPYDETIAWHDRLTAAAPPDSLAA